MITSTANQKVKRLVTLKKKRKARDEEQIYEGELASLKRFKDDVKEVRAGYEKGCTF